jgi:ribonuclease G
MWKSAAPGVEHVSTTDRFGRRKNGPGAHELRGPEDGSSRSLQDPEAMASRPERGPAAHGYPVIGVRREIIVNATGNETRVAILEDGRLVELMHERPDDRRMVGDIYLGVVEAVVPGLQAAFVDIAAGKSAFLHASDLAELEDEENGDRRSKRYPPIQDVVKRGQSLLVQVTKEPIGTKGPRVTSQVSLPGRFLVYMPFSSHVGISRRIEDRDERARLREMAKGLLKKDSGGVIVRTVGEELTKDTFKRELRSLQKTWDKVGRRAKSMKAPVLVHEEARLTSGVIRDVFSERVDLLTIDSTESSRTWARSTPSCSTGSSCIRVHSRSSTSSSWKSRSVRRSAER